MSTITRQHRRTLYERAAASHGLHWIAATPPERSGIKTLWRCGAADHIFWHTLENLIGCPLCAILDFAQHTGICCLSIMPDDPDLPVLWACSQNHTFESSLEALYRHHATCPICEDERQPSTFRDTNIDQLQLADFAALYDLSWVGQSRPVSIREATEWQCNLDQHQFTASCYEIQEQSEHDTVCPHCRRRRTRQARYDSDIQAFGRSHGLMWLSDNAPKSGKHSSRWMCAHGHEFNASRITIERRGATPCPRCRILGNISNGLLENKCTELG